MLYTSYCLNKKCKDFRNVDVVQYSSYCATALFRNASVPSVVRISSYEKLWQKAYNNKFSLDVNLTTILERIALKKVNKVYGPSKFISEIISKDIDIKIDVIEPQFEKYNGILNESLYNKMVCGKKYLLFYGTIGRLKGVDLIADILFEILSKYSDLIFVFVGKDTTYNNISMINYIYNKAGKFRDRVLYLGKLKHSALIPIIINSFAVILPSRIDNLPNACIEAMAYGKVVVASTKSSFDQLIDSGINGFLFENGDSTSLLNTINMVLSKNAYDIKKMEFLATKTTLRLEDENNIKKLIEYYGTVINGYYEKTDSKANWRISK
jgi:glycosyltransferase involved in cell wall biosynthesis